MGTFTKSFGSAGGYVAGSHVSAILVFTCSRILSITAQPLIKTHGSVSRSPRSWRATPVSILTGRTIMQFLHIRNFVLLQKSSDFCCGDVDFQFQLNHVRHFRDMNFRRLTLVPSGFFPSFSFHQGVKVTIKWKWVILLP